MNAFAHQLRPGQSFSPLNVAYPESFICRAIEDQHIIAEAPESKAHLSLHKDQPVSLTTKAQFFTVTPPHCMEPKVPNS